VFIGVQACMHVLSYLMQANQGADDIFKLSSDIRYDATLTGLHPPPFGSTTVSLTPAAWLAASYSERIAADTVRSQSELVRADAITLCLDACARTHKAQQESTKKLEDRAGDIKFWRDQLRSEADLAARQTKALLESTKCLEKALKETQKPLDIAEQCLLLRQKRTGVDLIDDAVNKELIEVSARAEPGDAVWGQLRRPMYQLRVWRVYVGIIKL
jgi:hypothetical protein